MRSLEKKVTAFDPDMPIARAWTPPSSWYTDDDIHALELTHVFGRSWQPVARTAELPERGSYVAGCFASEPWVVVRGADDVLRAFFNTCRHKGREVVTGRGCAAELVCGYHAWRYDLDGRLRSAPRIGGIEEFDRGAMSLLPLGLEQWGPWVFVHRERTPTRLKNQLPELDAALERSGWSSLKFAGEQSWTIACNWKVYVDNYLDGGYHVPHMHPTLDAQLEMDAYRTDIYERSSIQSCPPASESDPRVRYDARQRIGERALYAWIYPNFMINRYGPCLDTNHVVPLGPDRCRVDYQFYFADVQGEAAQRFVADSMAQSDVTQREDIAICESVQRGLASESYDRGRYAPTVETGEHHFHRLLAADYRRALARK
jgi:phenylpropionate dioxygenase-like ring-hydroxylating dioxygenase large terminal subunit